MPYAAWLPLLLGFLTAVGPISTDMYLPAFPAIEASLGLASGSAQITLATWFAGLAVGQLSQGMLSDRFGRRWPLIAGTALYTIASAGCALSPNLATLAICRALAAFGGSASSVIPRAIVRDLADGHAAARLMSRLMLVMGAAPILAPTLGGIVLTLSTWHAIFWIATVYGVLSVALVWRFLPDTLDPGLRVRLGPAGLLHRYTAIARERGFISHATINSCVMFGMFAYIGGSPVFIELFHISPTGYGGLFGLGACGFILASQVNARILLRIGSNAMLRWGTRAYLAATVLLTVAAFAHAPLPLLFAPIFLAMAAAGTIMPNATVGALSRHAGHAGTASALMGTLQFLLAAVSGILVGLLADGTARPLALLMLAGAICAAIADRLRPVAR